MTKFLNNADIKGYIAQTAVTSYLLKADSTGRLVAAIAGTDYQAPTTALLPSGGTAGQILAKIDGTNYNAQWIDNFAQQIKYDVKLGAALSKGTPVYVSSANGTNIIVSASSNATEATSSKTLGLLETGGALNDIVKVVSDGLLSGLNTSAATIGDPVWLGVNGALIFGLANKPSAPAHLVYIGAVTRVHATNGEIFIKVQNGFELDELHNVALSSVADGQGLFYESATSLWKNKTIASVLGYTPANGANYLPLTGGTISGDLTISSTNPRLYFTDTDNNPDYFISNTDGTFTIYDVTNSVGRFKIYTTGNAEFTGSVTTNSTFNITNGLTLFGNHISTQWYNGVDGVFVNYVGYNGGTTQFRNFYVYDGKQGVIATFDGSAKSFTLSGNLSINNGANTAVSLNGSAFVGVEYSRASNIFGYVGTENSASGGMRYNSVNGNYEHTFYTNSVSSFKLLSTRQVQFTAYTTSTSFSGTAAGYLAFDSSGNVITVAGVAATDNTKLPLAGGTTTGIVTFGGSNNSTDNVRFQNTDGNYAYIRQTAASNSNNVWYDGTLGATMWYAWDNPGSVRTAGVYTQHIFGTGRGTSNEAVTINRGAISGTNSSGTITYSISRDGDISLGGGSSSVQSTLASGLTAIRFPNQYSSGYTDAGVKLYIFNSGTTIQGFTAGPAYDLQYHSSGSDSGRHAFYVANSEIIRFNKTNVAIYGALQMATSGTSYIRMGQFPQSTSNSGETWIGRAADRAAGSMTVQLGGSSNASFFEIVDYAWTTVTFKAGMNDFSYKGNAILHAGNYSSYALPLSGGQMSGSFAVGNQQGNDNPGGWNKYILIDGTSHGRFRIKASNYTYGNIEVSLWADSSVSPSHGITGSNAVFSFGGSITSLAVGGQTVIHTGNIGSQSVALASTVTINYNNDTNSTYQLLWGSGNSVYGTSQVYVNPSSDVIYARGGYISPSNPWGTSDSAYFPNGITTAGGQNWIYGATFIGNAPSNGSGVLINSNGSSYFRSNVGTNSHGSSARFHEIQSAAGNFIPYSFESEYGNHSWGTVLRIRINQVGADRPSMQFSYAGTDNRWNVGYCYPDDNFRITQNMAYRNDNSTSDGWGTERFRINTDGNTYAAIGGTLYANGNLVWHASNAPRAGNSNLMYYAGFTLDANTMPSNSTGFTYSVNAPYTGPIAKFSEDGYPLQLNATYSGGVNIAYRTRNGDAGSWNSWYAFITTANIGSQSVSYANSAGSLSSMNISQFTNNLGYLTSLYGWGNTPDSWYGIGQSTAASGATAVGGYYPWTLSYHTGLALSAHSAYGGIRFYNQAYPTGPLAAAPVLQIINGGMIANGSIQMNGNSVSAGQVIASDWLRTTGNTGWYNNDYGQGLKPAAPNSYFGTVINHGTSSNGYGGYATSNNYRTVWMQNSSGDYGFYQMDDWAWNLFFNRGNQCWGIGTDNTYSGDGFRCIKYGSAQYGWNTWSDRRAKENISTITGALDKVLNMRGVYFNYIIDEDKKNRVGFIAQELESVLPEAVRYAEEIDEYSVEYAQIVSVLAEAIKEQNIEIQSLKSQLQTLLN